MGDLLSLSVVLISVLSFITSVLAIIIRVGFSQTHPFPLATETGQPHPLSVGPVSQAMVHVDKLWQWSASLGLPLNVNGVAGGQGMNEAGMGMGYAGGAQLVRMNMNWHIPRKFGHEKPPPPPAYDVQAPLSMAKIIMSRHHRRPNRPPRRLPGMPIPQQSRHSRLVESFV